MATGSTIASPSPQSSTSLIELLMLLSPPSYAFERVSGWAA
jgi:hypothetical protein